MKVSPLSKSDVKLRMKHMRNVGTHIATSVGLLRPKHLFIHIPKNGGMSVRKSDELNGRILYANRKHLKSVAYVNAVAETMAQLDMPPGYEHARLRDISLSVRKSNKAFAAVRNPWSRTVSRFTFGFLLLPQDEREAADTKAGFEAFLEERLIWGERPYFWHRAIRGWYPQTDYVIDETGTIGVDILRQEYLASDIARYFDLKNGITRKNVTKRRRRDYKEYYTPRTIQIIADWYKNDIETFGFDFDTAATRNTYFTP